MRKTLAFLLLPSLAFAGVTQDRLCGAIHCQASFQLQLFEPEMGEDHLVAVAGTGVLRHLQFDAGVMVNYGHKPLALFDSASGGLSEEVAIVEKQLGMDVMAAVGLFGRAELGLALPVTPSQSGEHFDRRKARIQADEAAGETPPDESSTSGLGDLRLHTKVRLMGQRRGLGLAFAPVVTVPTGNHHSYLGERAPTLRPRVVAGFRTERAAAMANLGYLIRENTTFIESQGDAIVIGDQFLYGGGASFRAASQVELMGELVGRMGASDIQSLDAAPAEIDVAVRIEPAPRAMTGFFVTGGGGAGIHKGIGSPVIRAFLGVNWAPDFTDTDHDGLKDRFDRCPDQPEDRDSFDDADGCPDPDNDQDLAPDTADKCPNLAEDRDSFEDEDGCPDPDNDGDKIPDIQDECPFVAGAADYKGCTADTYDSDGDGIKDAGDKCKDDAEDPDGYQDEDGCPDPDNDKDGVPDNFDDCPDEAEDADGFKDDDGCPDKDNDADGTPDADEGKPECRDIPGPKSNKGCPKE